MGGAETKCNSPHINGQCSNHGIAIIMVRCSAVLMFQKGLTVTFTEVKETRQQTQKTLLIIFNTN